MKLIKTASGKNKIKISKKEWTSLGKQAGWLSDEVFSDTMTVNIEGINYRVSYKFFLGEDMDRDYPEDFDITEPEDMPSGVFEVNRDFIFEQAQNDYMKKRDLPKGDHICPSCGEQGPLVAPSSPEMEGEYEARMERIRIKREQG